MKNDKATDIQLVPAEQLKSAVKKALSQSKEDSDAQIRVINASNAARRKMKKQG